MLKELNDLAEGYEIISPTAFSDPENCLQPCCGKSSNKKKIKEFIKPVHDEITNDIRLQKEVRSAEEVGEFVLSSLAILGFSHIRAAGRLKNIAYMMMKRFNLNKLNCRMDLVYSDKCKNFHVDKVYVRSITTLMGPGTELQFADSPDKIHKMDAGETLLIKGSLFPGGNLQVKHKSPKIAHLGISRLVFVMD